MNDKNVQIKINDNYYNGKVYYENNFKWRGVIYHPSNELIGLFINNNLEYETNIGRISIINSISIGIDLPSEIQFEGKGELKLI